MHEEKIPKPEINTQKEKKAVWQGKCQSIILLSAIACDLLAGFLPAAEHMTN